ncbi:SCO family protein [Acidicapsa acidisoli]|uniref:SCO family protein n=1 Tax=Acidicapsa acidisoli TaxID=1615681 RepID=UPI0021E0B399|nr:SCO family protein [Acidicapsa acidisoli]
MSRTRSNLSLFLAVVVLSGSAACLQGQNQTAALSDKLIPNVELIDQHGHTVHFYTDLVKGKVVAINTIFTTCTTICPLMGARFAKLSRLIQDADPSKVRLISISIDPLTDTPEKLDEWSHKFGNVGPAWTLLTGKKDDVDSLLKALEIFTADKQEHTPVVLIGVGGSTDWARASALLPPAKIADLIHARLASATTNHAAARP